MSNQNILSLNIDVDNNGFIKLNINLNFIELPVYNKNEIVGYTMIDKDDEKLVSKYKLMISKNYVYCYNKSLHILLLGSPPNGKVTDHINGNKFDNRRCNLRFVSPSVNSQNKSKINGSTSKYRGVCFITKNNKFKATFCSIHLGLFEKEEHAAYAYDEYIIENHKNDGYILNEIEKPNDYIKYIVKSISKDKKGIYKKGDKFEASYYNTFTKKHNYIGLYNSYEEAKEAYEKRKKEIENKKDKIIINRNNEGVAILTVKNKDNIVYTMVDDDIYEKCYNKTFKLDKDGYVCSNSIGKERLSRIIFGDDAKGKIVRYQNTKNRLDNRRSNLYLK